MSRFVTNGCKRCEIDDSTRKVDDLREETVESRWSGLVCVPSWGEWDDGRGIAGVSFGLLGRILTLHSAVGGDEEEVVSM